MLAFRSVQQGNHCVREEFLYELKAGPAARHTSNRRAGPVNLTAALRHHARDPARPLATLGSSHA
jgi:hypothetical protein